MATIRTIVREYLEANGFEGLFNDTECACHLGDLFPCDGPCDECEPGYKSACTCGEHDYHMHRTKQAANEENRKKKEFRDDDAAYERIMQEQSDRLKAEADRRNKEEKG